MNKHQEALKVVSVYIDAFSDEYYICPNCDEDNEYDRFGENDKYCPDCGQKLDWSDVK